MSRLFFVVIVNCSVSTSIYSSSSDLLGVSTELSVSYHWQTQLQIQERRLKGGVRPAGPGFIIFLKKKIDLNCSTISCIIS